MNSASDRTPRIEDWIPRGESFSEITGEESGDGGELRLAAANGYRTVENSDK